MIYVRRRALLIAMLALLAATAYAAPRRLLNNGEGRSSLPSAKPRSSPLDNRDHAYLATNGWPLHGQGAYALGDGRPARCEGQPVVEVRAGEQLTERDALMAILLPSANNIAVLVAREVAGSVPSFVAEMNSTARALGMSHTTYTDPSGYDDGTVSTALDQLRLAQVVANDETLTAMMATRSYWLPVAGEVTNTNALLGHDGFVGMKTGSDGAAGGCLMFRAEWPTEGGHRSLIGVVLGQPGDNPLTAGLDGAQQLVDRLAPGAARSGAPSASGIAA